MREPATREQFISQFFPNEIPTDQSFYERLGQVHLSVGYGQSADEALGLAWSEAMRRLPLQGRQALLRAFVRQPPHSVITFLRSVSVVIRDHAIPADFLADWFVDL